MRTVFEQYREKKSTLYLYNKLKTQAWRDVFKEFSLERGIPGTLVAMLSAGVRVVGVKNEVIKVLFQKMDNFHFESLSLLTCVLSTHQKRTCDIKCNWIT